MLTSLSYIPDGMTLDGYIAADPGVHGELHFSYRPLLPRHYRALQEQMDKLKSDKATELIATVMASQIVSWSLTHPMNGKPIEVTPAECERMQNTLFTRVYLVLAGVRASDAVPEAKPEQDRDAVSMADMLADMGITESREKNYVAG